MVFESFLYAIVIYPSLDGKVLLRPLYTPLELLVISESSAFTLPLTSIIYALWSVGLLGILEDSVKFPSPTARLRYLKPRLSFCSICDSSSNCAPVVVICSDFPKILNSSINASALSAICTTLPFTVSTIAPALLCRRSAMSFLLVCICSRSAIISWAAAWTACTCFSPSAVTFPVWVAPSACIVFTASVFAVSTAPVAVLCAVWISRTAVSPAVCTRSVWVCPALFTSASACCAVKVKSCAVLSTLSLFSCTCVLNSSTASLAFCTAALSSAVFPAAACAAVLAFSAACLCISPCSADVSARVAASCAFLDNSSTLATCSYIPDTDSTRRSTSFLSSAVFRESSWACPA